MIFHKYYVHVHWRHMELLIVYVSRNLKILRIRSLYIFLAYNKENVIIMILLYLGQFEVVRTGPNLSAIKLKNIAQPQYFLAVIGGYIVGYVSC